MNPKPIVSIKHGDVRVHSRWPLILIGIGKILKALGLIIVAFYILRFLNDEGRQYYESILEDWRDDPHNHILYGTLVKILAVPEGTLRGLRIGLLVYAGLYSTEGIGLLFDKPWAEWMTVITTAGFIPLEVYEVLFHPTWVKAGLLIFNILALVYICFRLRWRGQVKKMQHHLLEAAASAPPQPVGP